MRDNNESIRKRKPVKKEGVEYEPSNLPHQKKIYDDGDSVKVSVKKKKKSSLAAVFAITVVSGIIISIIAGVIAINMLSSSSTKNTTETRTETPVAIPEPVIQEIKSNGVAVIREVDSLNRKLELYSITDNTTYIFGVEGSTNLKSKYGETLAFAELKAGDIVDISFDEGSGVLSSLMISAHAFQLDKVSNVKIEPRDRLITIGNDHYYYSDKTTVSYAGRPYSITDIDPIDIVTIRGYQNQIYDLRVNQSHGFLTLKNKDIVKNGTLEINTSIYASLEESNEFKLLEGNHRIVIKGSNIEPFVKDIVLLQGERLEIDMSEADLKSGTLTVTSNVEDVELTINGVKREIDEGIIFNHGEYDISITKQGYIPYEETIYFIEAELTVEAILIEVPPEPEKPKTKKVSITSDPDGASLYINGDLVGVTPITLELEYGNHSMRFVKEGYIETSHIMLVDADANPVLIGLQTIDLYIPNPTN